MTHLSKWVVAICFVLIFIDPTLAQENPNGPFFGVIGTDTPQLLVPSLIASPAEEYNGTFSPDGTIFFYTTDIPENAYVSMTRMNQDGSWTKPTIAPFSGEYSDYDPLFNPDGSRLYFTSSRPAPDNEDSGIWYVNRLQQGWSAPVQVVLSADESQEFFSSLTRSGKIYFNIWSTGKVFEATPDGDGFNIVPLPPVVNADYDKGDPFISPDEDYLIFRGYRSDQKGGGDLYITYKTEDSWTEPKNLDGPINSESQEMCPYVTSDGKLFIFASARISNKVETGPGESVKAIHDKYESYDNGEQNIYYMSASFIERLRPD